MSHFCTSNQARLTYSGEDIQDDISMSLVQGCVRRQLEPHSLLWSYI